MRRVHRTLAFLLAFAAVSGARAERLPVRAYTTTDGLPHDAINRIVQDSHGYLWFCTDGGLSRYDGYAFENYGVREGLPHPVVSDLLESKDGSYWVATGAGLFRFEAGRKRSAAGGPLFVPVSLSRGGAAARVIYEDSRGSIWVGTMDGLYRVERKAGALAVTSIDLPGAATREEMHQVNTLVEDPEGALWIGTRELGVLRLAPGGALERFTTADGLPSNRIWSIRPDGAGGFRAATKQGICRFARKNGAFAVDEIVGAPQGLPSEDVRDLWPRPDGSVYAATAFGMALTSPPKPGASSRVRTYGPECGIDAPALSSFAEDRHGNLWIATSNGAFRVSRRGFTTYAREDGIDAGAGTGAILEDDTGTLWVFTYGPIGRGRMQRFDGVRFESFPIPDDVGAWGMAPEVMRTHGDDWLLRTAKGLLVFPPPPRAPGAAWRARRRLGQRQGLIAEDVHSLFVDSRGSVWLSPLSRWDPGSGVVEPLAGSGIPDGTYVNVFEEDRAGNIWIALYDGRLYRLRHGKLGEIEGSRSPSFGSIVALHRDRAGRIWIGADDGQLSRVDDPDAETPRLARYEEAEGWSGSEIRCLTEDAWGRIYVGTALGVERIDPSSGHVRRYSVADGLLDNNVAKAYADRHGDLWFATQRGLSRLAPEVDPPHEAPVTRITGLRVAGVPQALSPLGERTVADLVLEPAQNRLEVEFTAISFETGEVLRYQYAMDGADGRWSAPTHARSVDYASLSPGRYRFRVRAVTGEGTVSPEDAVIAFRVLSPVWQRPWAILSAVALLGLAGYGAHRLRVARLLALERVRMRIATDLHDDLGSTLSQIAIVSEVVRRRLPAGAHESSGPLARVAENAREAVESLADIVWSVDPRLDRLQDLVQRTRRFAEEMAFGKGFELRFTASPAEADRPLSAEARRALYLAAKESVNNAARHSGCRLLEMSISTEGADLVLRVRDDGAGFDPASGGGGHGVESLRRRAAALGGRCEIRSSAGGGTTVEFRIPASGHAAEATA